MTDLTVVVLARDETAVCGPTVTSAEEAITAARERGYDVQPVIALAGATAATSAYVAQSLFDGWERHDLPAHAVRRELAGRAAGRAIVVIAAGDLVSRNLLVGGLERVARAEHAGESVVVHPELCVTFDGARSVTRAVGQDSPLFMPHLLYTANPFGPTFLAPREAFAGEHADAGDGAEDDRGFVVETMMRGWRHLVAPETILFRRERPLHAPGADVAPPNSSAPLLRGLGIGAMRDLRP